MRTEDAVGWAVLCGLLVFLLWRPPDAPLLLVGFFAMVALNLTGS